MENFHLYKQFFSGSYFTDLFRCIFLTRPWYFGICRHILRNEEKKWCSSDLKEWGRGMTLFQLISWSIVLEATSQLPTYCPMAGGWLPNNLQIIAQIAQQWVCLSSLELAMSSSHLQLTSKQKQIHILFFQNFVTCRSWGENWKTASWSPSACCL